MKDNIDYQTGEVMDKVWAVLHSTDFENCTYIMGIFSSKEKALKCIKGTGYKKNGWDSWDSWESGGKGIHMYEYTINEIEEQ